MIRSAVVALVLTTVSATKCGDCHCLLLTPLSELTSSKLTASPECKAEVLNACKQSVYTSPQECRGCTTILAAEGSKQCSAEALTKFCDEVKDEAKLHSLESTYSGVYHLDVDSNSKKSFVASLLRPSFRRVSVSVTSKSQWLYFHPDDMKSGERGRWVLGETANSADYDLASESTPAVVPIKLSNNDEIVFQSPPRKGNQTARLSISCMCETMQLTGANNRLFDGVYSLDMKRTLEAGSSPVYKKLWSMMALYIYKLRDSRGQFWAAGPNHDTPSGWNQAFKIKTRAPVPNEICPATHFSCVCDHIVISNLDKLSGVYQMVTPVEYDRILRKESKQLQRNTLTPIYRKKAMGNTHYLYYLPKLPDEDTGWAISEYADTYIQPTYNDAAFHRSKAGVPDQIVVKFNVDEDEDWLYSKKGQFVRVPGVSIGCVCKALLVLGAPVESEASGIYKMLVHTTVAWTSRPVFIKDTTAAFQMDALRPSDEKLLQRFQSKAQRNTVKKSDVTDDLYIYWSYGRWIIGSNPDQGAAGNPVLSIVSEAGTPESVKGNWKWVAGPGSSKQFQIGAQCLSSGMSREESCKISSHHRDIRVDDKIQCLPWSAFGNCSQPCGGGVKRRTRPAVGHHCATVDERHCNEHLCKQTCLSPELGRVWSSWSKCTKSCGSGTQMRFAMALGTKFITEGSGCATYTHRPCNRFACLQLPQYHECNAGPWSAWSKCSQPCGGGITKRTRSMMASDGYDVKDCPMKYEIKECNKHACPVDCAVGAAFQKGAKQKVAMLADEASFSPWSACTHTCGGGQQMRAVMQRSKKGLGGSKCPYVQHRVCGTKRCPRKQIDCQVTRWSDWDLCSHVCGGGTQRRTRTVVVLRTGLGKPCPLISQSRDCNSQNCPLHCENMQEKAWGGWSPCTEKCGGGQQMRAIDSEACKRSSACWSAMKKGKTDCPLTQRRVCNAQPCSTWFLPGAWFGSSAKGHSQSKLDPLALLATNHGLTTREHDDDASPMSRAGDCQVGEWGKWGHCSQVCGGGVQKRRRHIINPMATPDFSIGMVSPVSCPTLVEISTCNTEPCPAVCKSMPHDDWTICTKTCGGGTQARPVLHISAVEQERKRVGFKCPFFQERICNSEPCQATGAQSDVIGESPLTATVSKLRPKILMKGPRAITFTFSRKNSGKPWPLYKDKGAKCIDPENGDISNCCMRLSVPDRSFYSPGKHEITYTCLNHRGFHAHPVVRTVVVTETPSAFSQGRVESSIGHEEQLVYADVRDSLPSAVTAVVFLLLVLCTCCTVAVDAVFFGSNVTDICLKCRHRDLSEVFGDMKDLAFHGGPQRRKVPIDASDASMKKRQQELDEATFYGTGEQGGQQHTQRRPNGFQSRDRDVRRRSGGDEPRLSI